MSSKFLPVLVISFAALFFMDSCSKKTNTQGRYIPSNAAVVLHVNAESILEKLPWEEIKQNDLFIQMYADTSLSSFVKSAMDNPENTGIDTKKDLVFFMVKDSSGGYLAFEGTLKDAAKFKAYNASALKKATASEKNGIGFLVEERTTVSWDKDKFIVIADAPEVSQMNDLDKMMNKDSVKVVSPKLPSTRDGIATASMLYALDKDNSLAANEKFSELVGTKGDMHFWANSEALYQGTPATPGIAALGMLNIGKLYQGSFSTGTVQFENGKIDVALKSYAGKELTDIFKKYSGTKISGDMVKRLPAKDVAVFLAMNFKPEGIKEFAKLIGIDGLVNMGASYLGFNLDDFVKANKGDIVFSISDISKDSSGKTNAAVLFAASKGDKPSFDKLVAAGKKLGSQELGSSASGFYFNQNDKYFSIGTNKDYIDQFVTKEGDSKFDFFDKISSGPIGGFVNLQYILTSLRDQASKDSLGLMAMDASIKLWDNIVMNGGEFKDGGITQHFEVNLVDKTTNSLKQLNRYAGVIGKIAQQKKREDKMMDTKLQGDTTGVKDSLPVQ
jgi:hypothetical protein